MSKFRNFTITQNNYPDTKLLDEVSCKYIIYGKEIAESGTPHLQGFISFHNPRAIGGVIKELPGCHIEVAKTIHPAIEYCKKEGDFTERGVLPMTQKEKGGSNQWAQIYKASEQGDLDAIDPEIKFKYAKTIDYIHDRANKRAKKETLPELLNEWHYGPSGTGKSRTVRELYPDAYIKMNNKWWDGYLQEEVVIMEDFNLEQAKFLAHHLKIWADHYPFPAEKKGTSMVIRPKKFIVTSNYSIEEAFGGDTTGSLEPILRRFKVHNYNQDLGEMSEQTVQIKKKCFKTLVRSYLK